MVMTSQLWCLEYRFLHSNFPTTSIHIFPIVEANQVTQIYHQTSSINIPTFHFQFLTTLINSFWRKLQGKKKMGFKNNLKSCFLFMSLMVVIYLYLPTFCYGQENYYTRATYYGSPDCLGTPSMFLNFYSHFFSPFITFSVIFLFSYV